MNKENKLRKIKLNLIKNYNNYYKDNFNINETIFTIKYKFDHLNRDELINYNVKVNIAGRIVLKRDIGKVIFLTLQDIDGKIQIYLSYKFLLKFEFNKFIDIGDIIGVKGKIFKTKVGELSIFSKNIYLLSKSLKQLPEKFKGLLNIEYKSKKRYIDLISNKKSRDTFKIRSNIICEIRNFFSYHDFIEVETPILQPIPGGAIAKPFITKFNLLNSSFYLRIAPELYLKKLIVGGFNKIFEIGKSFRNEGISCNHNPEFTILEFYHSYTDYLYLINFIQEMIKYICTKIFNSSYIKYKNIILDFNKRFEIITMKNSIYKFNNIKDINIDNLEECKLFAKSININLKKYYSIGKIQLEIFKKTVEQNLIQPTFITEYPIDVSPLSKKNTNNSLIADRFELFISGLEIANGFSELNDPEDQHNRFINQKIKLRIKDNLNLYDEDYINALKYGLPPTSGAGIGLDRLIMLLTNNTNIRDVILFPLIRYKK